MLGGCTEAQSGAVGQPGDPLRDKNSPLGLQ
jgi:hypothetical protein